MKIRRKNRRKILIFLTIVILVSILSYSFINNILTNDTNDIKETDNKTTEVANKERKVNITFVGDILIEGPFYRSINKYNEGDIYFKRVNDKYFLHDDITIANLEVPISDEDKFLGDAYQFVSPPSIAKLISEQDIQVLGTANNHAYDQGIKGINSTIDYFNNNTNILTVGTYKEKEERNKVKIIEKNNIKIGFAAYTLFTNIKPDKEELWRISYYREPYSKTYEGYKNIMKNELENLVNNSDVQIVLMHWGNEFTYNTTEDQKNISKNLSTRNCC